MVTSSSASKHVQVSTEQRKHSCSSWPSTHLRSTTSPMPYHLSVATLAHLRLTSVCTQTDSVPPSASSCSAVSASPQPHYTHHPCASSVPPLPVPSSSEGPNEPAMTAFPGHPNPRAPDGSGLRPQAEDASALDLAKRCIQCDEPWEDVNNLTCAACRCHVVAEQIRHAWDQQREQLPPTVAPANPPRGAALEGRSLARAPAYPPPEPVVHKAWYPGYRFPDDVEFPQDWSPWSYSSDGSDS